MKCNEALQRRCCHAAVAVHFLKLKIKKLSAFFSHTSTNVREPRTYIPP